MIKYVYVETSVPGSQRICEKFGFEEWYRLIYSDYIPAYNNTVALAAQQRGSTPGAAGSNTTGTTTTTTSNVNVCASVGLYLDLNEIKSPHCLLQVFKME